MVGCRYGHHYTDWVPTPFGPGNVSMPGFECTYEGDKPIFDSCEEEPSCPAYEPRPDDDTKYEEREEV